MSLIVTQNWRGRSLTKESWNFRATESWTVTGTSDQDTAIEAAVSFDQPHSDNPLMRAGRRWAESIGPVAWKVSAEFSFGDHGQCANSPLSEPAKILWNPNRDMLPVELDIKGNPICNSAGDPFDPPLCRSVPTVSLLVRKWLPFYNVQLALQFQDKTNSNAFTVEGAGGVDPGQALCEYFKPVQEYTNQAPYVFCEYLFRFKPGTDPWQANPVDAGRNGWYSDPDLGATKGPIVDSNGNQPSFDVRLDGTGKPIDPQWKVQALYGYYDTPIANPNLPKGLKKNTDLSTAGQVTTLTWDTSDEEDFSALGI